MKISTLSRVLLIASSAVLIISILATYRNYQDYWILEGLELPFLFFAVTFSIAFFAEKRVSLLVGLAVLGRTMLLLIPSLKYDWFSGTAVDVHRQYMLSSYVSQNGNILANDVYSGQPLQHLLISMFSQVANVQVSDAMKILPIVFSAIFPLLTYMLVRMASFPQENRFLKYALFISSLPFTAEQYVVWGTVYGIMLAFLIIVTVAAIILTHDRRFMIVSVLLVTALAAAHSVTSALFSILIFSTVMLAKLLKNRLSFSLKITQAIIVALIGATWLMFPAYNAFNDIVSGNYMALMGGPAPASEFLPPTFFALAGADLLAGIQVFLVFYGADFLLLVLAASGWIMLLRDRKSHTGVVNFLILFSFLAFFSIIGGVVLRIGAPRMLHFARLLYPFLAAFFILSLKKKTSWLRPLIFTSIFFLCAVGLYGYQPFIPQANIVYKDLPNNVPIAYLGQVNTVYLRQTSIFAKNYISTILPIATDSESGNQLMGLAGPDFYLSRVMNYNPLRPNSPRLDYVIFIVHLPGKSGTSGEHALSRVPSLIMESVYNSSVIYDSGESFILYEAP